MDDAGGVQAVSVTVTAAGLQPDASVAVHEETGLVAVVYGPVLLYVEDRSALGSFVLAWRQARDRAARIDLPLYADPPTRTQPKARMTAMAHVRGHCPVDVVGLARGVSRDGEPSVRVRVDQIVTLAYDLAAVIHLAGLWEQAAARGRLLPVDATAPARKTLPRRPGPVRANRTARP